jgi:hypothetical protein
MAESKTEGLGRKFRCGDLVDELVDEQVQRDDAKRLDAKSSTQ